MFMLWGTKKTIIVKKTFLPKIMSPSRSADRLTGQDMLVPVVTVCLAKTKVDVDSSKKLNRLKNPLKHVSG